MRALIPLLLLFGCTSKAPEAKPKPLVRVATAEGRDVPRYIEAIGHIEPVRSVDVQAQVTGVIEKRHFERGDYVKEGDLLFTIDQRPYIAELEKADAILSQNLASLKFAQDTADRNTPLAEDEYVSQNTYEGYITDRLVDEAKVKQTIAEIKLAQVNLSYCSITAPFEGRTGDIQVTEGNLVFGNDSKTLVTLNQIAPIYANFYIPERNLEEVRAYRNKGELTTEVWIEGGGDTPIIGSLFFIDNEIDRSTGMIRLKSTFPNKDHLLWPDRYVRVHLVLEILPNAVLVPSAAIQLSTKGKYLYVIDGGKAEKREITVGQRHGDDYVILTGLSVGETVVTEGQINLTDGTEVRIDES